MLNISDAVDKHKSSLLKHDNCHAVAVGLEDYDSGDKDKLCIHVFVHDISAGIDASELEGFKVKVVPRIGSDEPVVRSTSIDELLGTTNPLASFNPLICGISVINRDYYHTTGSIGCFISIANPISIPTANNTGVVLANPAVGIPAGVYLLSNSHILNPTHATTSSIIQPGNFPLTDPETPPPPSADAGVLVASKRNSRYDTAISSIVGRGYLNQIPAEPGSYGWRTLRGIGAVALMDEVYKFGAKTRYTRGTVFYTNYNTNDISGVIGIKGHNEGVWNGGGDSGSVVVKYQDDMVLGLNFGSWPGTEMPNDITTFKWGFAYDIALQANVFGTGVSLA